MKLTIDQLQQILPLQPNKVTEEQARAVYKILGFTLKEYQDLPAMDSVRYEVHYQRFYICRVRVDESPLLSVSNEYLRFGGDTAGISIGGIRTFGEATSIVSRMIAPRAKAGYDGTIYFDKEQETDEDGYTMDELSALVTAFGDLLTKTSA